MSALSNLFENVFDGIAAAPNILENATVYEEKIFDNGRRYEYRYFGKDKDTVEAKAKRVKDGIDPCRSPSVSSVQPFLDGYSCIVKFYGLD